jgi:hypothetical protein
MAYLLLSLIIFYGIAMMMIPHGMRNVAKLQINIIEKKLCNAKVNIIMSFICDIPSI